MEYSCSWEYRGTGSSFMHTLALFPAHGVIIGSLEINGDSGLIHTKALSACPWACCGKYFIALFLDISRLQFFLFFFFFFCLF